MMTSFTLFGNAQKVLETQDDNIISTNHLSQSAKDGLNTASCMWLRGILPLELASIEPHEDYIGQWAPPDILEPIYDKYDDCSDREYKIVSSGTYYGDASGGDFSSLPMLRRCGTGVIHTKIIGNEIKQIWGCRFKLIGDIQTVPRAELYALHFLLQEAVEDAQIEFVTDNQMNSKMFNQGKEACQHVANNDLFKSIFYNIHHKNINITVRWMPSHLSKKIDNPDLYPEFVLPDFVSLNDVKGNQWADDLCGKAARNATLPLHITTPIIYYKNLIVRIQRRLVAILCTLPNRSKHNIVTPKAPIPHDTINTLIAKSEHILYEDDEGKRVLCIRCNASFSLQSPSLKHWLKNKCHAIGSAIDRPIPLLFHAVHIKNKSIHTSHKLHKYKDLYYCRICGAYGRDSTKIQKLAQNCEPPTAAGMTFLNNASNGKFPFGYHYSILPQEQRTCLNKVMHEHQQLVEATNLEASSIPITESQPATPPVSPLSRSYSPKSPAQEGSEHI